MTKVAGILWLVLSLNFAIGITLTLFTGIFTYDTHSLDTQFGITNANGTPGGYYDNMFQGNNISGNIQNPIQVSGSIANNPVSQPFNAFSALNLISINFLSQWFNMISAFLNGIGIFLHLVIGQFLPPNLDHFLFGNDGTGGVCFILMSILWIWAAIQLWTGRNL